MSGRKRKRRRYLVPVWIGLVLVVGIGVNVWMALRQGAVEAHVREALRRELLCGFELGDIELGWSSGCEVHNFRLIDPQDGDEIARVRRLRLVPRVAKLFAGAFEPSLVSIEGLDVRLEREASGRWNVESILRPRPEEPETPPTRLPDIVIRGCRLEYSDERTSFSEAIDNIEFSLSRDSDRTFSFRGELEQRFANRLEVSGKFSVESSRPELDLRVRAWKLDLGGALLDLLPRDLVGELRAWDVGGRLDLDGDLRIDALDGFRIQRLGGRLIHGRARLPEQDLKLEGLSANLLLLGRRLEVDQIEGRFAGASLTGGGAVELSPTFSTVAGWEGRLFLDRLHLDARVLGRLAPELEAALADIELQGWVAGSVAVPKGAAWPPRIEDVEAALRLEGLQGGWRPLPVTVSDLHGELVLERGQIRVARPLRGRCVEARVSVLEGFIDLSPHGGVDLKFRLGGDSPGDSLVLDDRCRQALPESFHGLWDDFQLRGHLDGTARLHRKSVSEGSPPETTPLEFSMNVFPRGGRMAHKSFPYEVRDVEGEVRYDTTSQRVTIVGIEGRHGDQVITCEGAVQIGETTDFRVDIHCDDIPFSPEILAALPAESRELVEEFAFQGRMKADVRIYSDAEREVDVVTELELIEGTLRPVRFPYQLELAGGHLVIVGDRTVEMRDIRTAPDAKPSVVFDGSITTKEALRRIQYAFRVADLEVDEKLRDSLPLGLDVFFRKFGLEGVYHGKLSGWFVLDQDNPENNRLFYQGTDVRSDNAAVDFGIRIEDMKAKGNFLGGHTRERPNHFWGDVFVESAWFNRLHLTGGEVAFWFGEPHAHVIADVAKAEVPGRKYRILPSFLTRLGSGKVRDTFQMSVHSSDLYGGLVDGFLYVDTGEQGDIGGHFIAKELKLPKAARDIFGVDGRQVSGVAEGHVEFRGTAGDVESIVGKGLGVIKKAQLVELPFFLQILNVLKLDFAGAGSRNYFSDVSLPYEIKDGLFRAEQVEIKSPAITLVGQDGTLDFNGQLDLVLQPQVVDTKLPLWDQFVGLLKDVLASVRIRGDLTDPRVEFVTAGGLIKIPVGTQKKERDLRPLPRDVEE